MYNKVKKSWSIISTADTIWSIIKNFGLAKIITSLAGGTVMGILASMEKIPLVIDILIALVVILIVIWVWNGIIWRMGNKKNRDNKQNTEYLGDYLSPITQKGHEEQWLRPVIEWIDFNRDYLSPKEVMIKYNIDSGLVYDFKPYRMWIKLRIGQYEPKDGWEILQTPNLPKGKRTQFASETFTITDERLLKRVEKYRAGAKVAITIKIIAQLRDREELRELGQSYSINQYSEYSQEME